MVSCPLCTKDEAFLSISCLTNCLQSLINGKQGLICPICQIISFDITSLQSHLIVTHSNKTESEKKSRDSMDELLQDFSEFVKNENEMEKRNKGLSDLSKIESRQKIQCEYCGWNFDSEDYLSLHKALLHSQSSDSQRSDKDYPCTSCSESFNSFNAYVNHARTQHNDMRYICHICAKMFKLRGSLLVHHRVVHSGPETSSDYTCKICNRKFPNKYRKEIHEKRHNDSRSFERKESGVLLHVEKDYESHQKAHSLDQNISQKSLTTQSDLANCNSIHEEDNFSSPIIRLTNSEDTTSTREKTIICPHCDKVLSTESNYTQHLKIHECKQWSCDVCHKSFTTKYFLKKHKRLHTGETPYSCSICGKSFTFQQSYYKHMLYHTDEKPYGCSFCGRTFKELSTLQNHERIHSGERPFECETCNKSFRQRVSYLVHRRIHTGAMPYTCNNCGKNFRYKVTQRTHKCSGYSSNDSKVCSVKNPLSEEHSFHSLLPILPQNIQNDLEKFRKAQSQKYLHHRLKDYLKKSKESSYLPRDLSQLSLSENNSFDEIFY